MITEMERSPEVLREFYLIAINKGTVTTLGNGSSTSGLDVSDRTVQQKNREPQTPIESASFIKIHSDQLETGPNSSSLTNGADTTSDNGSGGLPRRTYLKIVQKASKKSSCRQCCLYQFHCDRQKPSCFKCERYSLPCYYDDEEEAFRPDTSQNSPELLHIPWEESAKLNPYHQLGGKQKLNRINRPPPFGPKRGRLSKPAPSRKRSGETVGDADKDDEEGLLLLGSLYAKDSDIEAVSVCSSPASSVYSISRPASPISIGHFTESEFTSRPASEPITVIRLASPTAIESRPISNTVLDDGSHDTYGASPSEDSVISPISPPTSPVQQAVSRPVSSISRPGSSRSTVSSVSNDSLRSRPTESSPRRSLSVLTVPSLNDASNPWLPPPLESTWDDIPKSFQCTFCLQHCDNQDEWERHEVLHHLQRRIWVCMPNGPVERLNHYNVCVFCGVLNPNRQHGLHHAVEECCYTNWHRDRTFINKDSLQRHLSTIHHQSEMTPRMHRWFQHPEDDEWYWNCGFCEIILPSWTKRVEHIATHFNVGASMAHWDPLLPPYPLDRTTMSCAAWFPSLSWDAKTLWDLRGKRSGWSWVNSHQEQYLCQHCDVNVYFRHAEDAKRHEQIWHSRRETWSCPTIEDIAAGDLARFFFRGETYSSSDDSTCPFCARNFIDIANSDPEIDDIWDIRVRHLEFDHNFDCEAPCSFASADHLLLHLANIHKVCMIGKSTSQVLASCKRNEVELAEKMTVAIIK